MKKQRYSAKTKEEAIKNATIDLQELEENLIVVEKDDLRPGFPSGSS